MKVKVAAYCNLNLVPVRRNPGHREEMVNQLLFSDEFFILEQGSDWVKISSLHDQYEGWIQREHIGQKISENHSGMRYYVSGFSTSAVSCNHPDRVIPLVFGTILPNLNGSICNLWGEEYVITSQPQQILKTNCAEMLNQTAVQYLGTPYLWGGRSHFGIDCSGLVQMVFRINGLDLPRDAWMQAKLGTVVNIEEALPGDLAFFGEISGKITHVGFVFPDQKILHASGMVRMDGLQPEGIYNTDRGVVTHKLQIVKRLI
ncbi:MAG: NlpC/P60 family protein [Bacteroidales bacterium]